MIITYLGKQFFKITQGDLALSFNPVSKDSKLKDLQARFGADIALSTINHPDYNGTDQMSHGTANPFIIDGPGDYEVRDIFIKGVGTDSEFGGKKYINTIYTMAVDGINLCFLGALSSANISAAIREEVGSPDVLFVPIGGSGLLSPAEAYKLSVSFEPKIIIPMDYGADMQKDALKIFLKEGGAEKVEPIDKLTIKKKDLEGKEGEIIILK
jgi:hypothetical protein